MFCFLILILLIVLMGISYKIEVTHTYIKSKKINSKISFAIIGDLHSCDYGNKIIDILKKENIDFILNVGDMYDCRVNLKNTDKYFFDIKDFKSYYVTGNHELYRRNDLIYKKIIREFNTVVLEGNRETLKIRDNKINIIGVDDIQIGKRLNTQLKRGMKGLNTNCFSILMFHRPHLIDIFNKQPVDLIVSGHAHSGQWRIPFTGIGILAPQQGLFPKYTNGLYKLKNNLLYVTRGLAKESVKVPRLYNRPEIAIIHLISEND